MHGEFADDSRLAQLCATIKGLRDEAIKGRASSGIETIWTEDREYYDGIDDSNRATKQIKPTTSDGRLTAERKEKKTTRSNAFLNITSRYVNAAAAYVSDKLFPSDDSNYDIRPTPIPELIASSKSSAPAIGEDGQQITLPVMGEDGEPQMQPQMINGQPMIDQATGQPVMLPASAPATVGDLAKQEIQKARQAAERAKTQIDDWLNECGINGHARRVVHDSAMIGTGVLKGPFAEMVKSSAVIRETGVAKMVFEEKLVPKVRRISAWRLYPDPSCGDDIHRGKYIFEDDEINSRCLGELRKDPSYMADAITRVLEEGPKHALTGVSSRRSDYNKNSTELYRIWYFHGYLSASELECCGYQFEQEDAEDTGLMGIECESDVSDDGDEQHPVIVVMVNDTIIKATLSPFDSGRFPYNVMRWQYMDDHWAGVGVARQMRTSQEGVNAGVRMMHDNAGVSGAPILIFDRKRIIPADGIWSVGPHKVYYTTDDHDGGNIRDAITWIITPSMQVEMMNIIQFWMKAAEEETGMPMLLQGQQGGATQTKGGMEILNNNGSALLRRVTHIYDSDVTKRNISAFYEWLLLYGEDDSMKGDFTIDARGSSVLIERDAHSQLLMQMLGMSLQPAYGADPELVYKEFLLSQRFDAEKLLLSDEKKAELAKRQQPPPPQIAAAQIRAQSAEKIAQMRTQSDMDHAAADAQLTMAQQQFDANEAGKDRQLEMLMAQVNERIEAMKGQGAKEISFENLKAMLASTSLKLNVQKDLSLASHMVNLNNRQVMTPPSEPAGRARPGRAFEE